MLGVGDSISDDVIQEGLQHSTSLLIDETRDPLDSWRAVATEFKVRNLSETEDVIKM